LTFHEKIQKNTHAANHGVPLGVG